MKQVYEKKFQLNKAYIIVQSFSLVQLEQMVNSAIENGYIPTGAAQFVIEGERTYSYMQSMIKKEYINGGK